MASAMSNSDSGGFSDKGKGRDRRRKKEAPESPWKTEMQERMYSSKLVQAIRFAGDRRLLSMPSPAASSSVTPAPSRVVREAADKALAVAARGRSRWSRAILSRRQRKVRKVPRKKPSASVSASRIVRPAAGEGGGGADEEMGVEKRVRALGRLVPGGRKMPFSTLLEETMDYMAALEMQVRAMTALSELLSTAVATQTPTATATTAAAVVNPAPCN